MKTKKRDIIYAPAPPDLVAAIRQQLRKMVEVETLEDNLGAIGRFANEAEDLLMCVKAPEAVMRSEHEITVPGVLDQPPNVETYGATMARTLVAVLKNWQQQQNENPHALVAALALAREKGMTDLATELEVKLLGKPLREQANGGPQS